MKKYFEHPISVRTARWLTLGLCAGALSACSSEANESAGESIGRARQAVTVADTSTLAAAAAFSGRRMGAAVDYGPLVNESDYSSTLAAQFAAVTPENAMKWGFLQPTSADSWDFTQSDAIVNAAIANGQAIKGHTLVWHQQLPPWISENMKPGKLEQALTKNIKQVVKRYAGKVRAWDVVNEAVADDGSGLRDSIFLRKLGPGYIAYAFNKANEFAQKPNKPAKLYYNDYGIETINPKSDAVYALMQELLASGVPVHGVGMQAHIDATSTPSIDALKANFQRFIDLGLTVNLSELDVQVADVPGDRTRRLAVQKQVYHRIITACTETPGCDAVTTWGFTDKYSWIDSSFGPDDPLPFDEQYQKKPAFYGIIDGFVGVPPDSAEAAPNYVANSTLEAGADGWVTWGDALLSASTNQAHTGQRSAFVTNRSGSYQGAVYDVRSVVTPGAGYDASIFARVAGSASEPVNLTAQVICNGQEPSYLPLAAESATDTEWVELSATLAVPDCQLDALNVYVEGPAAGVELYADDFTLREQEATGLGPELIPNTNFDSSVDWWFGWGGSTVTHVTDAAHAGSGSAHVTDRGAPYAGVAINLLSSITPGASYQASAWGLLDGAASAQLVLTVAATCKDMATQYLRVGEATASDADWTKVGGSVTLPDCELTDLFFYMEGPDAGIYFYFDDASFREKFSTEGPNVLRNSDFESGTDSWWSFGPTSVGVSNEAHGGNQSMIGSGRTGSWNGIATNLLTDTAIPLVAGTNYAVTGWTRIAGAAASNVNLTLQSQCQGDAQAAFTPVANASATDTAWAELDGALTVPTCTLTTLVLYIEGAPAGVDILLDDIEVREQL